MTEEELNGYGKKIRKENLKRAIKNILINLFIVCFGFVAYTLMTGDFMLFVKKTKIIKAEIVNVKKSHWGKGAYRYIMTYEFSHDNEIYQGDYDLWRKIDKKGDSVFIKYVVNNPKINKVK